MVFSSLTFLYIFLLFAIVSYSFTHNNRSRNNLLLGLSLFFYAWGEPIWVFLMIIDAFVVWLCSIQINKIQKKVINNLPLHDALQEDNIKSAGQSKLSYDSHYKIQARIYLIIAIVFCLALLLIFKYTNFFVEILNVIPFVNIPSPNIRLPIGISFFTFQIITYIVDVYRRDAKVQNRFADLLLYVSIFPQLIAGPIVRYSDVAEQINRRLVTSEKLVAGIERFLIGLGKKTLIANYAGTIVRDTISSRLSQLTTIEAIWGLIAYAMQIYFDFSAYSDMAIGLGRMFGFEFLENFDYPYISKSVTEFWRRWHMSLGTFFKDYVYIPLGGKYKHQLRNIFIVWLLTGFWHGAAVNFILWGLYYALLLVFEKYFFLKFSKNWPSFIKVILTFIAVCFGWIFFYFIDFNKMAEYFRVLLTGANGFSSALALATVKSHLGFIIIAIIASTPLPKYAYKSLMRYLWGKFGNVFDPIKHDRSNKIQRKYVYDIEIDRSSSSHINMEKCVLVLTLIQNTLLLLLSTASLISASYNPFLYFRF